MFSCNMLVLSYIHILWAISGLIGSRVFSGFFLARSVHKGGFPYNDGLQSSGNGKKDQDVFKKDNRLLKKDKGVF